MLNLKFARTIVASALCVAGLAFVAQTSHASHKDVGGGNGVGGVLLDRIEYGQSEEISDAAYALLHDEKSDLLVAIPFLENLAIETFLIRKDTYIGDYTFIDACKNESLLDVGQEVIACQNDVELRIQKSWWSQATQSAKVDLLIHELIRSLWLETPSTRSINAAVYALLRGGSTIYDINAHLSRADLPMLYSAGSTKLASQYTEKLLKSLCAATSQKQAEEIFKTASKDFEAAEIDLDKAAKSETSPLPLEATEAYHLFTLVGTGLVARNEFGQHYCEIQPNADRADYLLWDTFKRSNDLFQK